MRPLELYSLVSHTPMLVFFLGIVPGRASSSFPEEESCLKLVSGGSISMACAETREIAKMVSMEQ